MRVRSLVVGLGLCLAACAPASIGDAEGDDGLFGDLLDDTPLDAGVDASLDAETTAPGADAAAPPPEDASPSPAEDAAAPPEDVAAPPPDVAASPCDGVACPMFAACQPATGQCACDPGFELRGAACVTPAPGDPAGRAEQEVCGRFQQSQAAITANNWQPGPDMCAPGVWPQAALDSGIERINLYRWLTGLAPLDDKPELNEAAQACAVVQRGFGSLTHSPPPSTPCYTELGAAAAGHSNIAGSYSTASAAIDGFMEDTHTPVLGHRRWILFPSFAWTGLGYVQGYYCQWVDWGQTGPGRLTPDFVAWPNPGFVPAALLPPTWSFASRTIGLTEARVTLIQGGVETPLESYRPDPNYGEPAIAFAVSGVQAGAEVQIRLDDVRIGGELTSLTYTVQPTACR